MKLKLIKFVSFLSLIIAAGAISGASRAGSYQDEESKELLKFRKY